MKKNFKHSLRDCIAILFFCFIFYLPGKVFSKDNTRFSTAVTDLITSGGISQNYRHILSNRLEPVQYETGRSDLFELPSMEKILNEQPSLTLSPLQRSMLFPGWGQMSFGRTNPGRMYMIAEIGALGFLGYTIFEYNGMVDDYDDARTAYDSGNYGNANAARAQSDFDAMKAAHDDAESAKEMILIAGGLAGGIYVINIIDALLFSGGDYYWSLLDRPDNSTLSLKSLKDSEYRLVPGISFKITCNLIGWVDK